LFTPPARSSIILAATTTSIQHTKHLAEACGSRIYLELILQVLTRKALDGIGRT
jgi:hypothetical protein